MASQFQQFKNFHYQHEPLLLGNAWNAQSAKILAESGYQAIGTSSAAIAHSMGYEDGEQIPFDVYYYLIERITKSISIPVSVDLEAGYGTNLTSISTNIRKLADLGIVGINIEDSVVKDGVRTLENATLFAEKLQAITNFIHKNAIELFVNVRTDTFLLRVPNMIDETLSRIKLYENSNADGLFVPGITDQNDIIELVKSTKLPLNVMCMPSLPSFKTLQSIGVKRISMGNFTNDYTYRKLVEVSQNIRKERSFNCLF